ncbi:DUF3566 domain-containing protein [Actinokineospora sp.]|uniref:DUF3566 domain-containing protein n=1 Tax=Actinokineospora sp. TaxID=1872133 RepID=UPI004037EC0A
MTPSDKPEAGPTPEHPSERTSYIATTNKVGPVDASSEANGTEPRVSTPPPWQRVPADESYGDTARNLPREPDGDTTQSLTADNGHTPAPHWPTADDTTRSVVTGTAASHLFGNHPTDPTPPRTPVHLDGGGVGGLRTPATAGAVRRPGRGPRRANLQIKRFDPWSVLKLSLVLGVALFFVWLVAVGALYAVLDGMGVWDKLNGISSELLNASADGGASGPLISAGRVFGVAAIIGAINIVLFSALATVGAFVYNVSADLAGGLEVTLAERE